MTTRPKRSENKQVIAIFLNKDMLICAILLKIVKFLFIKLKIPFYFYNLDGDRELNFTFLYDFQKLNCLSSFSRYLL